MNSTPIQWADLSWNPTRGCSRVSEGCRNCYAEKIAARFSDPGRAFHGFADRHTDRGPGLGSWTGKVSLLPEKLHEPLSRQRWAVAFAKERGRRPRCFVNSTSDLFHEKLTNEEIAAVFGVMAAAPWITFVVLTKRARRMREWFEWIAREREGWAPGVTPFVELPNHPEIPIAGLFLNVWPLPNVQLGVSVENQETADERIPELLATPAAVRVVSYEPALGPVDFRKWLGAECEHESGCLEPDTNAVICRECDEAVPLDQIIVGGESGPNARPCRLFWIRSVVRQCREAGVGCFVKQLGKHPLAVESFAVPGDPPERETQRLELRDSHGGDPSEWPADLRVRELPEERA